MSRANPFNKDKQAIEDNLAMKRRNIDKYWDEGSYFTWAFGKFGSALLEGPVEWFYRNQEKKMANWRAKHGTPVRYHAEFPRVKRADQCETDDVVCLFEANEQMLRDRILDEEIIAVLKQRMDRCLYENPMEDRLAKCEEYRLRTFTAMDLYDTKYGDLPFYANAIHVLSKQKHRLMREREGTVVYPPFTTEAGFAVHEKIHPSTPVNKEYPINPFPISKTNPKFTYNGKLKNSEQPEPEKRIYVPAK